MLYRSLTGFGMAQGCEEIAGGWFGETVIETTAAFESALPSLALKVKLSEPL